MKYTWAYLCCNPEMLRLTLKYLPRETPFKNLERMVVFYPAHLVQPTIEWSFACEEAPGWLTVEFRGITPADIPPELKATRFMTYWDNPRRGWSLGIKQLVPLIFQGPVLYTDDDVLVPNDPWWMLEQGEFCTAGGFNRMGISVKSLQLLTALDEIFNMHIDIVDYNQRIVDAGIFFVHEQSDLYEECLMRMWTHPYYLTLDEWITEFRCADQRFLTYYGTLRGWWRATKSKERRIWYQALNVLNPKPAWIWNTTFVHYGASSHKPDYIRWFKEVHSCKP